jgi:hypothetical protein
MAGRRGCEREIFGLRPPLNLTVRVASQVTIEVVCEHSVGRYAEGGAAGHATTRRMIPWYAYQELRF